MRIIRNAIFVTIAVLFIAETFTAYNRALNSTASGGQELNRVVLRELAVAKRGDILRMRDNSVCVVVAEPLPVWETAKDRSEIYEMWISCRFGAYERGRVEELVPRVGLVSKATDVRGHNSYNILAGAYLRQLQLPEPSPAPTYKGPTPSGPMPTPATQ